jgi:hypothetical protein
MAVVEIINMAVMDDPLMAATRPVLVRVSFMMSSHH